MGRRFRVQEFDDIIVALMGASGWLSLLYFGRGNQVCVFAECVFVGGEGEKGGGSAYFGGLGDLLGITGDNPSNSSDPNAVTYYNYNTNGYIPLVGSYG